VPQLLETVLLASLGFQELTLIVSLFLYHGSLGDDSHVHQCVEVWVDAWGKQLLKFCIQTLSDHILLLFVLVYFLRCIAS
jgi:hypothetical protein